MVQWLAKRMYIEGNANRGVVGYFLKYPPQRKIMKIPPQNFGEILKKPGKTEIFRLI